MVNSTDQARPCRWLFRQVPLMSDDVKTSDTLLDGVLERIGRPGFYNFGVIAMLVVLAIPTAILLPLREVLGVMNLMPMYLLLSLGFGLLFGPKIASLGAVIAFVIFDLLFIPPYYTLTINSRDHVFMLVAYLVTALVSAQLMSRLKFRTGQAMQEAQRSSLLYELNRGLVREVTEESLLNTVATSVVDIYGAIACSVLSPDLNGGFRVLATHPAHAPMARDRKAQSVAQAALQERKPLGLGGATLKMAIPHSIGSKPNFRQNRAKEDVLWVPILSGDRRLGLLEVQGRPRGGAFSDADRRLLSTFADQAALAIERTRLVKEASKVEALQQSDVLKSALLSAVSHDLRTPLTAIKASASGLLDTSVNWSPKDRRELLQTIDEESDRLTRMVTNLLDLSRIEAGVLQPDRDWHDLNELIDDVVERTAGARNRLQFDRGDAMPLAYIDYVKISQVVENVVGNAIKFSPEDRPVEIESKFANKAFTIVVRDHGPGIDTTSLPRIFDAFYRSRRTALTGGTGVGLSIAKGFVEAHNGTMGAASELGHGAVFTIALPQEEPSI